LASQVKRNIDNTIGTEWELILVDNTIMKKGICEVYNEGAEKSKYNIICFVHEDVLFETKNWGRIVQDYFANDKTLKVVGIAGAKYKSNTPSGWSTGIRSLDCCSIFHVNKEGKREKIYSNPNPAEKLQPTITIDGVFMCTTKQSWMETKFNNQLLRGFHLYDLDFSIRNSVKGKVAVSFEIDLVHLTEGGDFGDNWVNETLLWHRANERELPAATNSSLIKNNRKIENIVSKKWLHRLKSERISFSNRVRWLRETRGLSRPALWPHIFLFFTWRKIRRIDR
jgi:hypothetical protein